MNLDNILKKELCCILKEKNKNEVLIELIDRISSCYSMEKTLTENITKNIFYREQLMSTGIGLGIAIPHIRFEGVSEPIMAVGISKTGIKDYVSIDNEIIRIVVMIIAGINQHKEHIRLLSMIVSLLKQEDKRKALLAASNANEVYRLITGNANVE